MITIYQYNTRTIRAVVNPGVNSQQEREIMGKDVVNLSFLVADPIKFSIGDYAEVFGSFYKLNTLPIISKSAKRNYEYQMTLEGLSQDLGKVQFLFLDSNNQFTEGDFNFTGKLIDFASLIIYNLKRVYPDVDWKLAGVVDSGYKTMEFSGENCLSALSRIAEEFETEYFIDGLKIYLYKRAPVSGLVLKYGEGLHSLTRQNKDNGNVITQLYPFGSDRNIGSNYRNGARHLRLSPKLYIEKNVDKYGVFEGKQSFPEIYPRYEGKVTAVAGSEFVFTDENVPVDINDYLMPGVTAKVTFNTGQLAGVTFEVSSYSHSTKTFTIVKNTSDQTMDVPSSILRPAIGDEYVIIDILMPLAYIESAEEELRSKAEDHLDKVCEPQFSYNVVCDPIYFKKKSITIQLGSTVGLCDEQLEIDQQIRVAGYTRNLRIPSMYTLELSDKYVKPVLTKLIELN